MGDLSNRGKDEPWMGLTFIPSRGDYIGSDDRHEPGPEFGPWRPPQPIPKPAPAHMSGFAVPYVNAEGDGLVIILPAPVVGTWVVGDTDQDDVDSGLTLDAALAAVAAKLDAAVATTPLGDTGCAGTPIPLPPNLTPVEWSWSAAVRAHLRVQNQVVDVMDDRSRDGGVFLRIREPSVPEQVTFTEVISLDIDADATGEAVCDAHDTPIALVDVACGWAIRIRNLPHHSECVPAATRVHLAPPTSSTGPDSQPGPPLRFRPCGST